MRKAVISGATGMLGLSLLEKCIRDGVQVIALVSKNSKRISRIPASELVKIIECNLEDYADFEPDETDRDCDVFFHFAWGHTTREGRNDIKSQEINLQYSLDSVELAKRFGCKKYAFAGSQAEYGVCQGPTIESQSTNPVTPYATIKVRAEEACEARCKELDIIFAGLRIYSVYGPYDMDYTMVATAVSKAISCERMNFSSGLQTWNFLYQDDFAEMTFEILSRISESGIYNVGHLESMPLKNYIAKMGEVMPNFEYSLAPADDSAKPLSIEPVMDKTLSLTGVYPKVSFEEGINRIYKYYKQLDHEKNNSINSGL